MNKEFEIDAKVTIDRYNHIDDVEVGRVVGYTQAPVSGTLLYRVQLSEIEIQTSGLSIMESKDYVPVLDHERHKKFSIERELELSKRKHKIICFVTNKPLSLRQR